MKKSIYFDFHTSLHPFKEALENLKRPINPHCQSLYFAPNEIKVVEKDLWDEVFKFFGASKECSLVLKQDMRSCLDLLTFSHYRNEIFHSGKQQVLVAQDAPLLKACWDAYAPFGVVTSMLSCDAKGLITPEALKKALSPRTTLVSICWAHPLTGVIQPIEALAQVCKDKGVALHVDMSHVVGTKYFSLKDIGARYVTFNAQKFFGAAPLSGVFFCDAADAKLAPSQSSGSLNELLSFKTTLYQVHERIDDLHLEVARLRRLFEKKLLQLIPESNVLNTDVEKLPQVSVIYFPKVMHETLLYFLSLEKVFPSLAENDRASLSEMLLMQGISSKQAYGALSFCLSHLTTEEQIHEALERICIAYQKSLQFSQGLERSL